MVARFSLHEDATAGRLRQTVSTWRLTGLCYTLGCISLSQASKLPVPSCDGQPKSCQHVMADQNVPITCSSEDSPKASTMLLRVVVWHVQSRIPAPPCLLLMSHVILFHVYQFAMQQAVGMCPYCEQRPCPDMLLNGRLSRL